MMLISVKWKYVLRFVGFCIYDFIFYSLYVNVVYFVFIGFLEDYEDYFVLVVKWIFKDYFY